MAGEAEVTGIQVQDLGRGQKTTEFEAGKNSDVAGTSGKKPKAIVTGKESETGTGKNGQDGGTRKRKSPEDPAANENGKDAGKKKRKKREDTSHLFSYTKLMESWKD